MTIVILSDEIPPEGKGGAERVAWDTACALQKEGNDVHVITTTRDVRLKNMSAEVTTREGVTVHTFYIAYHPRWRAWVSLYNPVAVKEVRRILNEVKPTLVHAHNIHRFISYESLRVSSKRDIPVFLTAHDFMLLTYGKLAHPSLISPWKDFKSQGLRYNPFRNLIIRRALHSVTEILAVSKAVQEVLVQHGIERVSVLHNGILPQEQEGTPDQIRAFKARYGLEGKKVILFGGRISASKGGDALIAALPMVVEKVQNAVILLMGTENEYVHALQKRVAAHGLRGRLIGTGWISGIDIALAYAVVDVVTTPSVSTEPLATVVLEAMAAQRPVVASSFGGFLEMVVEGKTGYLMNPLDTKAFADRLSELLQDPAKAQEFGRAGRIRQQKYFSMEYHVQKLLSLYAHALKHS